MGKNTKYINVNTLKFHRTVHNDTLHKWIPLWRNLFSYFWSFLRLSFYTIKIPWLFPWHKRVYCFSDLYKKIVIFAQFCQVLNFPDRWARCSLRWRHNGRDSVSNHQPHHAFIQTQIKENITVPRHWPMCGEFTGDRWIPRTKGQ